MNKAIVGDQGWTFALLVWHSRTRILTLGNSAKKLSWKEEDFFFQKSTFKSSCLTKNPQTEAKILESWNWRISDFCEVSHLKLKERKYQRKPSRVIF